MTSGNQASSYVDVNSRGTLAALIIFGSVGIAILLIAPIVVGQLIAELGFTPQQCGYIISADMAGLAVATLPALWWLNRINWQIVARVGLIASAFFLGLSMFTTSFDSLLVVRFLGGLSSGTVVSITLATCGLRHNRERGFGLSVAGQLILGAVSLALLPYMLPATGIKGVFIVLAGINLACLLLVRYIPTASNMSNSDKAKPVVFGTKTVGLIAMGILGLYSFYVALNGVWTFMERIGVASGMDAKTIAQSLAVASTMGIAGAVFAALLGARWGKLVPTGVGIALLLLAFLLLRGHVSFITYFVAACLFKFAWTFVLPYFLGAIAGRDASGRSIVIGNIFVGGGLASGPAIAALLISGENYDLVLAAAFFGMSACFLLFAPLLMDGKKAVETEQALKTA